MWALLLALPGIGPLLGAFGSIVKAIGDTLGKILPPLGEVIGSYFKALWDGLVDMLDNSSSVIFVLTLCVAVFIYSKMDSRGFLSCDMDAKQAVAAHMVELRKKYVFIERKDAVKKKLKDAFTGN